MKIAKFMFKFKNKMLPISFDNYLTNLSEIHIYNSKQKAFKKVFEKGFKSTILHYCFENLR